MSVIARQVLAGFAEGYYFNSFKQEEMRCKRMKGYYSAALFQAGQFGYVCASVCKTASLFRPMPRAFLGVGSFGLSCLGLPITLLAASVRNHDYKRVATRVNHQRNHFIEEIIPKWLKGVRWIIPCMPVGKSFVCAWQLTAKHAGTILSTAMLVHTIVITYLGAYLMGGAMLITMGYHHFKTRGYVPDKADFVVKNFVQPLMLTGCAVFAPMILRRVLYATSALFSIPSVRRFVNTKIDDVLESFL